MLITMATKLCIIRVGHGLVKLLYHFCVRTQCRNSTQKGIHGTLPLFDLELVLHRNKFLFTIPMSKMESFRFSESTKNLLSLLGADVVVSYIHTGVHLSWEGSSVC